METEQLVQYEAMRNAIAECRRVDEVKEIRDKAVALAAYAKQAGNVELEKQVGEIRLRAERRAGELIKEMKTTGELREGGNGQNQHSEQLSNGATVPERLTLDSLGISRSQSSDWQRLAEIPLDTFETAVADSQTPLTAASIVRSYGPMVTDRPFQSEDHWKDMPEFVQTNAMPVRTLYVHFEKYEDVQAFAELVDQKITLKTKYIWYPKAAVAHFANKRWVDVEVLDAGAERTDGIDTVAV